MNNSEILTELIKENLAEIRHNTDHRQGVTQFIFTIGAGIGFAATTDLIEISNGEKMVLGILAIGIGLLGMVFTRKLHERQRWYSGRLEKLYERLDKEQANLKIAELYKSHQEEHAGKFKFLSKFRTNVLWMVIHFTVVLLGIGIIIHSSL